MNSISRIFTAATIVLAASCGPKDGKSSTQTKNTDTQTPLVEVIDAAKESVPYDGEYSTTVMANIINNIASQQAGRIRKINVEVGDFVAADQILAEMDKSQLEQASLRYQNAEVEYKRVAQLFKEGGISQSDFDQIEMNYKVSKSTYENLLENTILRSPISGVVTARNYDKGDMYSMSQPLFTVQQITPVKLLIPISESDYTRVDKGDEVTISADAIPGQTFSGKIVRIHPTIDAASHTFNIEVHVANESRSLRPGMFARAKVNFGAKENIVIPDQAAVKMQGAGTRQVYVLNADNTVSIKVVELGRHYDSKYEVLSGLEEGDRVIVKGQANVKAGDKVLVK